MRYGYCIFCDDIRNEVGEKLSFIGCYNGSMFVPSKFPLTPSKFCAHVTLLTPSTQPYESIVLRCYGPGENRPLIEEQLETPRVDKQEEIAEEVKRVEAAPVSIVAAASLVFSPLKIRQPGLISVRAVIDGKPGEINVGSLVVTAR
jgi:hypothetical protein